MTLKSLPAFSSRGGDYQTTDDHVLQQSKIWCWLQRTSLANNLLFLLQDLTVFDSVIIISSWVLHNKFSNLPKTLLQLAAENCWLQSTAIARKAVM